ncbi:hypothetical protein I3842_12G059200 [Carya illinoinensis]|uniref:Tobamovirus multiplication protein 2B n=1 Tax=Carya illinoinensis TaxID=32201 RepID=A0A922DH84_CARIL|nr:hypothetical protein I3842_12G059200 [Carya illinoinensis]
MAASTTGGSSKAGTAKALVADQISQTVQSTSNLLHLMQQSSSSQVLEQMPHVISSLDAHMEKGLQSVPHLKTVIQLLANMESCQLNSISQAHLSQQEHDWATPSEVP